MSNGKYISIKNAALIFFTGTASCARINTVHIRNLSDAGALQLDPSRAKAALDGVAYRAEI
jgi:hypothetical protein